MGRRKVISQHHKALDVSCNFLTIFNNVFMKNIVAVLFFFGFLANSTVCSAQTHVVGGAKTYRFWAGEDPDSTIKVINGEYWSYAHFTKEYKMFLELKVKPDLAKSFITDNSLKEGKYREINDAPKWFKPPKDWGVWEGSQGSIYYINLESGHMYMYEVQL